MRNVNVSLKISSLQCSWLKRLYDDKFHEWKIIPQYLIKNRICKNFTFHSNVCLPSQILDKLPTYYKELLISWEKVYSQPPSLPSLIGSQFLWFNALIKIDKKTVYNHLFSNIGLNFVIQLFDENGKLLSWNEIKQKYKLPNNSYFKWYQLVHAIPTSWKKNISEDKGNCRNLVLLNHHLIKKNQIYSIMKLTAKELYYLSILSRDVKPTSQTYFENLFEPIACDWEKIYMLPRKVTIDSQIRSFQYKILNNILYLNKKLFIFGIVNTPLCSFCGSEEETTLHLFLNCTICNKVWLDLKNFLKNDIDIPLLSPQSAIFGFLEEDNNMFVTINQLLLLFKYFVYKSRDSKKLSFQKFLKMVQKIRDLEKIISQGNQSKEKRFNKKWKVFNDLL